MTNYRRLISYIYAYEGDVKGKNIGFAKLESRNGQCKLSVNVKKVYVGSSDLGVYLLAPGKEILLGNIFIRGGSGEFRAVVSVENAADSGCSMDQCYGLTVHDPNDSWRAYTTIWEDAVARAAELDLADVTSGKLGNSEKQIHKKVEELAREIGDKEKAGNAAAKAGIGNGEISGDDGVILSSSVPVSLASVSETDDLAAVHPKNQPIEDDGLPVWAENSPEMMRSGEMLQESEFQESEFQESELHETELQEAELHETELQEEALQEVQPETNMQSGLETQAEIDGTSDAEPVQEMEMQSDAVAEPEIESISDAGTLTDADGLSYMEQDTEDITAANMEIQQQSWSQSDVEPQTENRTPTAGRSQPENVIQPGPACFGTWGQKPDRQRDARMQREVMYQRQMGNQSEAETWPKAGTQRRPDIQSRTEDWKNKAPNIGSDSELGGQPQRDMIRRAGRYPRANVTTRPNWQESSPMPPDMPDLAGSTASQMQPCMPGNPNMQPRKGIQPRHNMRFQRGASQTAFMQPAPGAAENYNHMADTAVQPENSSSPALPETENPVQTAPAVESVQEEVIPGNPQELERLDQEEQTDGGPVQLWENFRKRYPKIQAFDSANGCEILTVKPQDIGLLPRENWNYGNNSFLLHGYYNYRYLILARIGNEEQGRVRYILGVPGHYYSNEKYMASMFGFPHFVLAKKQPSQDGRFGYWYADIRMENQD